MLLKELYWILFCIYCVTCLTCAQNVYILNNDIFLVDTARQVAITIPVYHLMEWVHLVHQVYLMVTQ